MSGPAPIVVEFLTRGIPDVLAGLKTIGDRVTTASRIQARGGRDAERSYAALVKTAEKWRKEQVRAVEQTAAAERKAAEKSAGDRVRAGQNANRKIEAEYAKLTKTTAKWQKEAAREASNAKKAETKAAEKATKEKERLSNAEARKKIAEMRRSFHEAKAAEKAATKEAETEQRRRDRIRERSATYAGKFAHKQAREERKAREAAEAEHRDKRERLADAVMGGTARAGRNLVRGATAVAGTMLNLGGGFTVQETLRERLDLDRNAIHFSNAAFQGREGEQRIDPKAVQETAKANAIRTGTDASELLAASNAYGAKSGDYAGGLDLQEFFGKVAKGTGSRAEDVAAMAGLLKVQNKDLGTSEMKALVLNMVRQGQAGSVEASDLAKIAGKVTRTSSSYAGDQGKTQGKLLGLSQIAMRTSGNANEAATVLSNLSADALKHRDKVGAAIGKDFLNAKGQIAKAPEEFLADVMAKTDGNLGKVADMGFGARSMKMFQALSPVYNEAEKKALDEGASKDDARKAARSAVLADMREMTDAAMSEDELNVNVGKILESSAEQLEAAVRQLKTDVADQLIPVLREMIPLLQKAVPPVRDLLTAFVGLVRWAESNPLAAGLIGLTGMITAEIMKQIVAAKIGDLIKGLLAGNGKGPVPGAGAIGGKAGKALAVVGAGLVAGDLTKDWLDEEFGKEGAKATDRVKLQLEARNLASAARNGALTPEQKARAVEVQKALAADAERQKLEMDPEKVSFAKKVTGAMGSIVAPTETAEAQQVELREHMRALEETKKSQDELREALKANTEATKENSQKNGGDAPPRMPPNRNGSLGERNGDMP